MSFNQYLKEVSGYNIDELQSDIMSQIETILDDEIDVEKNPLFNGSEYVSNVSKSNAAKRIYDEIIKNLLINLRRR